MPQSVRRDTIFEAPFNTFTGETRDLSQPPLILQSAVVDYSLRNFTRYNFPANFGSNLWEIIQSERRT